MSLRTVFADSTCTHEVQFYVSESSLATEVGRFMRAALRSGRAGVIIATPANRDRIEAEIAGRSGPLAQAIADGRYFFVDAAEGLAQCLRNGWPDQDRFAAFVGGILDHVAANATDPNARVAVYGEMVALLTAEGRHEAAIQLERAWNTLAKSHTFDLRCAYPIGDFTHESAISAMYRICAEHGAVTPTEHYTGPTDEAERRRVVAIWEQKAKILDGILGG